MADKEYFGEVDYLYLLNLLKAEFSKYVKTGEVEPGAEVNVQSDWNETNTTSDAFIKNKPTIPEQIQSDWNQTNTAAKDYIKNKPNMSLYALLNSPAFTGEPTAPDPDLTTGAKTRIATKGYVERYLATEIGKITQIEFRKVDSLPGTGEAGVIYLVKKTGTLPDQDVYTEYYWAPKTLDVMNVRFRAGNGVYGTVTVYKEDYDYINSKKVVGEKSRTYTASPNTVPNYNNCYLTYRRVNDCTALQFGDLSNPTQWYSLTENATDTPPDSGVYTAYYTNSTATGGQWEILGDTSVDLSNYLMKTDVAEMPTDDIQLKWDLIFNSETI